MFFSKENNNMIERITNTEAIHFRLYNIPAVCRIYNSSVITRLGFIVISIILSSFRQQHNISLNDRLLSILIYNKKFYKNSF